MNYVWLLTLIIGIALAGCDRPKQAAGEPAGIESGVALVTDPSPEAAGKGAVVGALKKLGAAKADVIIVFVNYKEADATVFREKTARAFAAAKAASGGSVVVGTCATAGIITSGGAGSTGSVAALALQADGNARIATACVTDFLRDEKASGAELAAKLAGDDNVALVLLTDSNISHNKPQVAQFLGGVRSKLQKGVAVAGGNSAGFSDWNAPVFYDGKLIDKGAVGVMISGDLKAGWGYANNFDFVNNGPLKVTRSDGRKVYELNGKPIAAVIEEITGADREKQKNVATALTHICAYKIAGRPFIRFQRGLKEDASGAYYDGWPNHMPIGTELYLAKYNQSRLVPTARESVERALASNTIAAPQLLLSFNCNGRSGIGKEPVAETQAICSAVGNDVTVAGFYACGEIGTVGFRKEIERPRYMQFSSTILVIGR